MKKRQLFCFAFAFILLFNLISPNIVCASSIDNIVEEKKEFNPTFDFYYLPGVDINEYSEYIDTYGDFPKVYNLGIGTQDVMTVGTAVATMINPTYVAVGGAVLIAYLGYKYYQDFKHNIRNDGTIVIDAQLRDAFKNVLNADANLSETIITSGEQNIPTHFTTTSYGTAYEIGTTEYAYYNSFKATSNSFIFPRKIKFNATFTSDICNEIADITNKNVFNATATNRFAAKSDKFHFKPNVYFDTKFSYGSPNMAAYGGFYYYFFNSSSSGYLPKSCAYQAYGNFDATSYTKSGVVSATVDIIECDGITVTDSTIKITDDIVHEVNMPSTEDILDIPMDPVTNIPLPDGSVIKPTTGITDQIIDIPIKDIVNIEVPDIPINPDPGTKPDPAPDPEPDPKPDPEPDSVTDWPTFFTWIANFFINLGELFQPLFDYISNFFDFLGDLLTNIFSPLLEFVVDFFAKLGDLLNLIFKPLFDFISSIGLKLKNLLIELFVPTIDLETAFELPDNIFLPFHEFEFDDLFNVTPKPIRFDIAVNFGSVIYPIKIHFDEIDIISNNIGLIRNIFSYTLLLASIYSAIAVFLPKRVMD